MKRPNTLFVGQAFIDLQQVDSTNAHALTLLSTSRPADGTVISTHCQTKGRGQVGTTWESEPGKNISLSVILYPDFLAIRKQFQLSMSVSMALVDFVKKHLPDASVCIKWPNDIYVGTRKIAGILIQNSLINTQIRASVVGIGINVNQTTFVTNPPNPASFRTEAGLDFELPPLVASLCEALECRYLQLKAGKTVALQQEYIQCLYRFGELANYRRCNGESFQGIIQGIDESGKLCLQVQGKMEFFDLKELRF